MRMIRVSLAPSSAAILLVLIGSHVSASREIQGRNDLEIEDEDFWGRFLDAASVPSKPTSAPTTPPLNCGGPFDACPCPTDACMNNDNFRECKGLEKDGCKNILVLESCPLQFRCGDSDVKDALEESYSLWKKESITDYDFYFQHICFCPPEETRPKFVKVRGSRVESVVFADDGSSVPGDVAGRIPTIDEIFGIIKDSLLPPKADAVEVAYNRKLGYPIDVYIDYKKGVADEEYVAQVRDLVPFEDIQMNLNEARALWNAKGLVHYDYNYQRFCFCLEDYRKEMIAHVRNERVNVVTFLDGTIPPFDVARQVPTIEGLFDTIEEAIEGADSISVTYDQAMGFPTEIYIDYNQMMADEELHIIASKLRDPGPAPCNNAICTSDEYCCNESCSLCAPLEGFCIQIACPPEPGK